MHSFKIDAVIIDTLSQCFEIDAEIMDTVIPEILMVKVRFETIALYRFYSIVNHVKYFCHNIDYEQFRLQQITCFPVIFEERLIYFLKFLLVCQ